MVLARVNLLYLFRESEYSSQHNQHTHTHKHTQYVLIIILSCLFYVPIATRCTVCLDWTRKEIVLLIDSFCGYLIREIDPFENGILGAFCPF